MVEAELLKGNGIAEVEQFVDIHELFNTVWRVIRSRPFTEEGSAGCCVDRLNRQPMDIQTVPHQSDNRPVIATSIKYKAPM